MYKSETNGSMNNFFREDVYKLFINGEYCESENKKTFSVENPFSQQPIAKVYEGEDIDINNAISAAQKAFKIWKEYTLEDRADILNEFARLFSKKLDDLA